MRRTQALLVVLAALLVGLAAAPAGQAADGFPLHRGSSGPNVCELQSMLEDKRPNHFRGKLPATLSGSVSCVFGDRTAAAVVKYKTLLGYPRYARTVPVNRYFIAFLKGKVKWKWPPGTLNPAVIAGPVVPIGVVLHKGSKGPRVANLQWLLSGRPPNVYTFAPYFKGDPNGLYGDLTLHAVLKTKWRLGYPGRAINGDVGRQFELILTGHKRRPELWVARAAIRLQAYIIEHTPCADRIIQAAAGEVGVYETSYNYSRRIAQYEAITGQFRVAWCASFVQWVLTQGHYGTICGRSAYVPYIKECAARHGWLRAIVRPGALVAFYFDAHHIGIVTEVDATGYWAISGNYGNRVARVFYRYGSIANSFIWLPGCVG